METGTTTAGRFKLTRALFQKRLAEYLLYDSTVFRAGLGVAGGAAGDLLWRLGKRGRGFGLLAKVHRAGWSGLADRRTEALVAAAGQARAAGKPHPLLDVYREFVATVPRCDKTSKYFDHPDWLLHGSSLVLKSPGPGERGVLMLYYSYVYPLFQKFYDMEAVGRRYHLVLEPSWSGFCDLNILCYQLLDQPVFVGTLEPRDFDLFRKAGGNLIPVRFGNNYWVDDRVFRDGGTADKDIDVLVVSGWGWYKRHWALFAALRRMVRKGRRPRVTLVGYPLGLTRDDILAQADHYGVRDLLDIHEWLKPPEVAGFLNRAKVMVLWSRKEGSNRSIIESLFADTPIILRAGHNYGYEYPYVNPQTGRFADERTLADVLGEMLDNPAAFAPREWALKHMTCQQTTATLNDAIKAKALELGENWTADIAVKTNDLNGLCYWNPADRERFAADYDELRSLLRPTPLS
jgi:glycosyltransferase involved in cell wall biosynthesis